eukprot:scaffold5420_cov88-Skeletonema_marinoi.AAC.1
MCRIGDVIHMLYLTVMTQIRRWKGCTNQVRCGGVCMRHGAKKKLCSSDGCTNGAVNGGVCKTHGAKVKLCSSEGCTNYSKKGGVCIKHGAVMKRCKIEGGEGGTNQSQKGGNVCKRHGETLYYAVLMEALIKFRWRPLGGSERCNNYIFKRMSVLEAMG